MQSAVKAQRAKARYVPRLPGGTDHLWAWFWRINSRRQNGMDLNPVSLPDIAAFQQLFGVTIRPWEAEALCAMDDAYCVTARDTRAEPALDTAKHMKATPDNVRSFFKIMGRGKRKNDRHRKPRPGRRQPTGRDGKHKS